MGVGLERITSGPQQAFGLSEAPESKQHKRNLAMLTKAIAQYQQENEQARMNAMQQQLRSLQPLFGKMNEVYGGNVAPDISGLLSMTSAYPGGRQSLGTATAESDTIAKANAPRKPGPLGALSDVPLVGDFFKGLQSLPLFGDLF